MCPPSLRQELGSHIDRSLHHQQSEREVSKNTTARMKEPETRWPYQYSEYAEHPQQQDTTNSIRSKHRRSCQTTNRYRTPWLNMAGLLPYFPNAQPLIERADRNRDGSRTTGMSHRFTGDRNAPRRQIGNAIQNVSANSVWISRSVS